jgi:hypothetical protein
MIPQYNTRNFDWSSDAMAKPDPVKEVELLPDAWAVANAKKKTSTKRKRASRRAPQD